MRQITREDYPLDTLQRFVHGVTFFKELAQTDQSQFELLMSVTHFLTADEQEVILNQGDDANILYFLVKGQLAVLAEDTNTVLNDINAGEVLGVMAMVLNNKRSASIQVVSQNALLAGIDYQYFRDSNDFSLFNLNTKLTFFRLLNNHIRWHLEQQRIAHPEHPLVANIRSLPLYSGQRHTQEELYFLQQQAHLQAQLLCQWNESHSIL